MWVSVFTSVDWPWVTWLYDRTLVPAILASSMFCWPVVAVLVYYTIASTAVDAMESAGLEGAGFVSRIFHIAIAGNGPALLGTSLLAFAICFGELSASHMVLPPGVDTIPRLTLGLLHAGVNEMTAALTIVTTGGIILLSLSGWKTNFLENPLMDHQELRGAAISQKTELDEY